MTLGTIVYLCWYDFQKQTEYVCKGEVVDNSLWAGKQQADMINVCFQAPGMTAPICHHFAADRLSMTDSDVPHDECYQVCAKRKDKTDRSNPSDAWQRVQQFKQDHWDYQLGHLDTDALEEYYQLWRDAIAAKRGYTPSDVPTVHLTEEAFFPATSVPVTTPAGNKLTKKQKRSTGAIQYTDSIQTSIFD
jgi:hypothetical protein